MREERMRRERERERDGRWIKTENICMQCVCECCACVREKGIIYTLIDRERDRVCLSVLVQRK